VIVFDKICAECGVELNIENWSKANMKHPRFQCMSCNSKVRGARREKVKKIVVSEYGGFCVCCKENHFELLTIDHIYGNGAAHRKEIGSAGGNTYDWLIKNNFPKDNFQLLCFNCNCGKRTKEYCPHIKPININDFILNKNFKNNKKIKDKICTNCSIFLNENNKSAKGHNLCKKCKGIGDRHYALCSKIETFEVYGNICVCCGEDNISFLTIDHIDESGASHRKELGIKSGGPTFYSWLKKNNYPRDNFQLLCYNCNCSKHFYGQCPHIAEREQQNLILP
jgi:hypothetical protein